MKSNSRPDGRKLGELIGSGYNHREQIKQRKKEEEEEEDESPYIELYSLLRVV